MNKALSVLAVVAVLGASFFAGQKSFGTTFEYDHADVIDAVAGCGEGQFIGGCTACGGCALDEYKAGGCSYFKNTFCTLCTDIKHCQHEHIRCTNRDDHICTQCDFGFWDVDCKACTVCHETPGLYEYEACQQDADAKCAPCTKCGDDEWTSTTCGTVTDSECTKCSDCDLDSWMTTKCQTKNELTLNDVDAVYTYGHDTVCAPCTKCGPRHPGFEGAMIYATQICNTEFMGQTECTKCDSCAEGQFISEMCEPGGIHDLGTTTLCQDCQERQDDEWTVFPCSPLHTSDAIHQTCSECGAGEYKFADCTGNSDTVCPQCPDAGDTLFLQDENFKSGLQYCKKNEQGQTETRCMAQTDENGVVSADSSKCGEWTDGVDEEGKRKPRCLHAHSGGGQCGEWISYCEEDFGGESCCYHKYPYNCGSITARERIGVRAGYEGETSDDFVDFCRVLCDEFPDCMGFEVEDGGNDELPEGPNALNGESICFFKAAYTQDPMHNWYGKDANFDCYSNTCRQNSYQIVGSRFAKTINYDVNTPFHKNEAKTVGDLAGR